MSPKPSPDPAAVTRVAASAPTAETDAATIVSGAAAAKPPSEKPTLQLEGQRLGKYEVRRRLGAGGMGAVFLAHDPMIDREVAIKVLPPEFSRNDVAAARFLGEARAAGQLSHVNVVAIYDIGQQDDLRYIVMELATGGSVANRIAAEGQLPFPETCRIVAEAARGLAAAHARGLVHRDVKPENLMLAADGTVKLVDFGLSKALELDVDAKTALTTEGQILGTPFYMSPEQFTGGPIDERSDVYGLGATYFHLLTGRYPFPGKTIHQVMYAHLEAPRPDPRAFDQELPAECAAICAKALARRPADRYPSMLEFAAAVDALRVDDPSRTRGPTPRRREPPQVLVVEPSKLQARVLGDAFARAGAAAVRLTSSGAEGQASNVRPDVVAAALQLPDMDGRAFARSLRTSVASPLTLLTTSGEFPDFDDDLPPCCAFVSKRCRPETLVALARLFVDCEFAPTAKPVDPSRLRLRVVSDDGSVPAILAGILRSVGILDVTTSVPAGPTTPGAAFDLVLRIRFRENRGLTTPSSAADGGTQGGRWSAVVDVDGKTATLSRLHGDGVAARSDRTFDEDRLRRLVELALST